jgi:type I restriction enzyme, R subunit
MLPLNERTEVELPFIQQLRDLGWSHIEGEGHDSGVPYLTGRESFKQVLHKERLRDSIRRINLDENGHEWLDDSRIDRAILQLERAPRGRLMEANKRATEILLHGVETEGIDGERAVVIHFIDWNNAENNDFLAIDQFRVDPPGSSGDSGYIIPDIVLFVNGIPVVVVECKSPTSTDPMASGINQIQRYANQRHWHDEDEGCERLFHYNQFVISTFRYKAKSGTFCASEDHFIEWKDPCPLAIDELAQELSKDSNDLTSQEVLIAGMMTKQNIIDIMRHFVLVDGSGSKETKIVGRYHQFRAVHNAMHRLKSGLTREKHGELDRRGGIIWHTQGSGKSMTMTFLVRAMRDDSILRRFKIVIVTDRIDLQQQLSETAQLSGEHLTVCRSISDLRANIRREGPGLIFAMIQQYQEQDNEDLHEILNDSPEIVVFIDEAHRTQAGLLHANLMRAMPNCAKIGFTGTPIIVSEAKKTWEIFGSYLDKYTIKESENDGATLPIIYEGFADNSTISDSEELDTKFHDMFSDRTPEEWKIIQQKHATKRHVLESEKLIEMKAQHMMKHYVQGILPNGFKAQVVCVSRLAAVRYQSALMRAKDQLIEQIDSLDQGLLGLSELELEEFDEDTQFLVRASRLRGQISQLESAAVISKDHNDDPSYLEWTDWGRTQNRISRFKKPLFHDDSDRKDGLAFLCVKSMLVTGFSASVEQVLYLDRIAKGHELLQTVARVNRRYPNKTHGLIVDYCGVALHLKKALAIYTEDDVEGLMTPISDLLPILENRHSRVKAIFEEKGVEISDIDACVALLEDTRTRANFGARLKDFLSTMDQIMPRPEALFFKDDAKIFAHISKSAANRYRTDDRSYREAGGKVRKLLDDYVISKGISPRIPPISLTDSEFDTHVDKLNGSRTKASDMEHALRYHLRQKYGEDPAYFEAISERLEKILKDLEEQWDELEQALAELIQEVRQGRPEDESGLDPLLQTPFLGVMIRGLGLEEETGIEIVERWAPTTVNLVNEIKQHIRMVGFWTRTELQNELKQKLTENLDEAGFPLGKITHTVNEIMSLAKRLHTRLSEW